MATKLKGKRGATFKRAWALYAGEERVKGITAVSRGFPTVITAPGHELPAGDIPVSLLSLGALTTKDSDGAQSFATKDRILASKVDADNFTVKVDSTDYAEFEPGGYLVYTPPQDLTGYLARAHFRSDVDAVDPPLLALDETDGIALGGTEGTVDMTISDERTTALEEDLTTWNVELESPLGEVMRLDEGTLELTPDVTRI
jgi:hypothetical protein